MSAGIAGSRSPPTVAPPEPPRHELVLDVTGLSQISRLAEILRDNPPCPCPCPRTSDGRRHGVSRSVSNIAAKQALCVAGIAAVTEPVELVVRWFVGDATTHEERQMITRIGCRTRQPGIRSLTELDPAIADDLTRRLIDVLRDRRLIGP